MASGAARNLVVPFVESGLKEDVVAVTDMQDSIAVEMSKNQP